MLNFMIAVIMTKYEKVINGNQSQVIKYKHKAELNAETYELISVFKKLGEYRCIIFSTAKEENDGDSEFLERFERLRRKIDDTHKEHRSINLKINV